MRVALAQINPTVGNVEGNYKKIISSVKKVNGKADLIVFPELSLSGYPPEDLVLKSSFLNEVIKYLEKIKEYVSKRNIAILLGAPIKDKKNIYNAGIFIFKNNFHYIFKNKLPNYGVFDEKRTFKRGKRYNVFNFKSYRIGVLICEDMWFDNLPKYLKNQGANIFISINASPFEKNKFEIRKRVCSQLIKKNKVPLIYLNQVGGQDELVFDGNSFFMNKHGEIIEQCYPWKEDVKIIKINSKRLTKVSNNLSNIYKNIDFNTWSALTLGLRDYFKKLI